MKNNQSQIHAPWLLENLCEPMANRNFIHDTNTKLNAFKFAKRNTIVSIPVEKLKHFYIVNISNNKCNGKTKPKLNWED